MVPLDLYLFGPPRVVRAGQVIDISLRKALALFVYLAVTRQPHSRDALATLLWPENNQREARASLRRTLYRLNEQLGNDLLESSSEMVSLSQQASLSLDIERFQHLVAQAGAHSGQQLALAPAALEQAVAAAELYTNDFMAGFTLPDCPAFDDWQFFLREGLRQSLAGLLCALVDSYQGNGEYEQAIGFARRWLALDPLHEPVHRQLMILYASAGQHAAALRQYAECERILDEELGAPPEDETRALYETIRTKRFLAPVQGPGRAGDEQAPRQVTRPPGSPAGLAAIQPASPPRTPRHNLPAQTTPFVGREQELAEILGRLRNPGCRLLTLAGPGGIGKTRLALQAGQLLLESETNGGYFSSGVIFVPLVTVQSAPEMLPVLAEALGMDLYNDRTIKEQIIDFLRERAVLLILDNFDGVVDGADLAAELVAAAPNLKLLITSREALNLAEEWFHPIAGLSFPPPGEETTQPLGAYGAVRLFEQCAHRARVDFSLAEEEAHVVRICRLVDGLPLALELAAAWLKTLSARAIADEIARGIDILTTQQRNVPERHRSMRAVLEQTWSLLSDEERSVLKRLAIFRGGFRRQAAREVAGATVLILGRLVDKSLVWASAGGRFQLHELLRQFAGEQLAAQPEDEQAALASHSRYYLHYLSEQDFYRHMQQALTAVAEDLENIRMAWEWALAHGDLAALHQALDPLARFYWTRSRGHEGREVFAHTLAQVQNAPDLRQHPLHTSVLHRLFRQCGSFSQFLGDHERAERDLLMALMLSRKLGLRKELASTLTSLGVIAEWQGERKTAQKRWQESCSIYEELGDADGVADVLHHLATLHLQYGEFAEGKRLAEESLNISRQLERPDWMAWAHDALGWASFLQGDSETAQHHYETSLAAFKEIGHQRGISLGLGGLGMVAWAVGGTRLAEARTYMAQSLTICRRIAHRLHTASRLSLMALILNDLHDYRAAETHAQEGLALASEVGSPLFMAYNLFCLAEATYRQDDFLRARRHLREALTVAGQAGLLPSLAIALYHAGVLLDLEAAQHEEDPALAQPRRARAAQLLALVGEHPACWCAYRTRAQQLLMDVASRLPAEAATIAQAQGRTLDLRAAAQEVVALL